MRPASDKAAAKAAKVSIHAPVWGATIRFITINISIKFQSTHPCGVRRRFGRHKHTAQMFQSTHPCGVRHSAFKMAGYRLCFNPRTRVGCDHPARGLFAALMFQSTHPCGVRQHGNGMDRLKKTVSIHAPVWGATS